VITATIVVASILSWLVGIITAYIGVVLQSMLADRKLKKRTCQALYDELDLNRSYLKKAVPGPDNMELPLPYSFSFSSYTEARNSGIFRELPKELRESIEGYYSFFQFLNTLIFGTLIRKQVKFEPQPKDWVKADVARRIDETLPKLNEFCSKLPRYRLI